MGDYVELHAMKLPAGEPVHISRVIGGDSDGEVMRAAFRQGRQDVYVTRDSAKTLAGLSGVDDISGGCEFQTNGKGHSYSGMGT